MAERVLDFSGSDVVVVARDLVIGVPGGWVCVCVSVWVCVCVGVCVLCVSRLTACPHFSCGSVLHTLGTFPGSWTKCCVD